MSTYTVTKDQHLIGFYKIVTEGGLIDCGLSLKNATERARVLNLQEAAEAMLALLVESQEGIIPAHSYAQSWEGRRDDLIRQINGEATP